MARKQLSNRAMVGGKYREAAYLANVDVLEGVDSLASLLDLTADNFRNKLADKLLQITGGSFTCDDLKHFLSDFPDLRRFGVSGLLDLVGATLGESDSEESEEVAIGGTDVNVGLDQRLPLSDQRPELVGGEVHSVEVGQTVLALNLIDTELNFTESYRNSHTSNLKKAHVNLIATGELETGKLFRKPCSSSLFRSARESSMIRPFRESLAFSVVKELRLSELSLVFQRAGGLTDSFQLIGW